MGPSAGKDHEPTADVWSLPADGAIIKMDGQADGQSGKQCEGKPRAMVVWGESSHAGWGS